MRCEVHCPDGGGALAGVVAVAVLVFVFAAVVSVAAAVVASVAETAALVVLSVCAAGSVVVWRLVRYGDRREAFRRHRRVRSHYGERVMARPALTRGPLAIEAPKPVIEGVVLDDVHERTEA